MNECTNSWAPEPVNDDGDDGLWLTVWEVYDRDSPDNVTLRHELHLRDESDVDLTVTITGWDLIRLGARLSTMGVEVMRREARTQP